MTKKEIRLYKKIFHVEEVYREKFQELFCLFNEMRAVPSAKYNAIKKKALKAKMELQTIGIELLSLCNQSGGGRSEYNVFLQDLYIELYE